MRSVKRAYGHEARERSKVNTGTQRISVFPALPISQTYALQDFMDHCRIAPRKRVLKSGIIDLGAGGTITCSVKNISESGALLEAITPLFIPDRFKLIVQTEHLSRPCQVIWRKEKRMGIEFK